MWFKYLCFERGISPEEFKKSEMRDIEDILSIKNAVDNKIKNENEIQAAMMQMKY